MAEEEGFEPSHRVTSLRAFQARPFSLLGIPPLGIFYALIYYNKIIKTCTYNLKKMKKYVNS